MLPISDLDPGQNKEYEQEYIFEPSKDAILNQLLPQYAESLIYGAVWMQNSRARSWNDCDEDCYR